jgi:hypothetical protein
MMSISRVFRGPYSLFGYTMWRNISPGMAAGTLQESEKVKNHSGRLLSQRLKILPVLNVLPLRNNGMCRLAGRNFHTFAKKGINDE